MIWGLVYTAAQQNQQNDLCTQRRRRSAWASGCMRTAKTLIRRGRCPAWFESSLGAQIIFIPRHTKSGRVLCYTLWKFWVSVRPSVSASFLDSNLSSFWPIFFKLCMDIDIGEEWVWDCKWAKFVHKQKSYNNNCLYFMRNTQHIYQSSLRPSSKLYSIYNIIIYMQIMYIQIQIICSNILKLFLLYSMDRMYM